MRVFSNRGYRTGEELNTCLLCRCGSLSRMQEVYLYFFGGWSRFAVASLGSRRRPKQQGCRYGTACHPRTETNLENVERLKLDVAALVAEEVHYQLEVGFVRNVAGHDVEVRSVQKNFSKELE